MMTREQYPDLVCFTHLFKCSYSKHILNTHSMLSTLIGAIDKTRKTKNKTKKCRVSPDFIEFSGYGIYRKTKTSFCVPPTQFTVL